MSLGLFPEKGPGCARHFAARGRARILLAGVCARASSAAVRPGGRWACRWAFRGLFGCLAKIRSKVLVAPHPPCACHARLSCGLALTRPCLQPMSSLEVLARSARPAPRTNGKRQTTTTKTAMGHSEPFPPPLLRLFSAFGAASSLGWILSPTRSAFWSWGHGARGRMTRVCVTAARHAAQDGYELTTGQSQVTAPSSDPGSRAAAASRRGAAAATSRRAPCG